MATESANKVECDIDKTYYPHLLLLPAGIILTILALLRRRTSFKKDIWGGRPGLVTPVSFLGLDHDRLAIVCVFGASTALIFSVVMRSVPDDGTSWAKAFLIIATAIEVAFLYYPFFGCLASYHTIIGAAMGLAYATISFILSMVFNLQKCHEYATVDYVVATLVEIPITLCQLFILGKFILVLYKELKKYGTFQRHLFFHTDERLVVQDVLVKPWLRNYVIDLVNLKPSPRHSRIEYYLRKIYNPEKNFKFSTLTLSVLTVCSIILYSFSISLVYLVGIELDNIDVTAADLIVPKSILRGLFGSLMFAVIISALLCGISLIRSMENHKNNMLKMFKGDKSFIPCTVSVSQFMVGKGLRYPSFQIGYFLWGYLLLMILLSVISFLIYSIFEFKIVRDFIIHWLFKGGGVLAGIALLTRFTLPITALTIFRDPNYSKTVISIDNRNFYLVFSYFWFFVGLPMGFFSAIFRILKAMAVGSLMLTRIDHSILPDGFQWLDPGFKAYIGYIHVQAAHRNPVLRVFCQLLRNETQNVSQVWRCSCKARTRWFLALTLARNPQLASYRKHNRPLSMVVKYTNENEVKIEVGRYGLMQDP